MKRDLRSRIERLEATKHDETFADLTCEKLWESIVTEVAELGGPETLRAMLRQNPPEISTVFTAAARESIIAICDRIINGETGPNGRHDR